jgi:hypothetical protein
LASSILGLLLFIPDIFVFGRKLGLDKTVGGVFNWYKPTRKASMIIISLTLFCESIPQLVCAATLILVLGGQIGLNQVVLPIVSFTMTSTTLLADAYFLVKLCGCCCCNADGIFEDDVRDGRAVTANNTNVQLNHSFDAPAESDGKTALQMQPKDNNNPPAAQTADLERCSTCNAKTKFCTCNIRRNTQDMAQGRAGKICTQKTSTGACTNIVAAGLARCSEHTCQHAGCTEGKSSKVEYCKFHANQPRAVEVGGHLGMLDASGGDGRGGSGVTDNTATSTMA